MLVNDTPRRPFGRETKLQVSETTARNRAELSESIYAMMACHGRTPYQVMRAYGLSLEAVMELFFEADAKRFMAAVKAAYRNGRLSMMPQPPVTMRRAA